MITLLLMVSSICSASWFDWTDHPKWESKAIDATVVLIQPLRDDRAYCSGSIVRDKDGKDRLYTAAHCCNISTDKPIYYRHRMGKIKASTEVVSRHSYDINGLDVCRVEVKRPLLERVLKMNVLKRGQIREYWRVPGQGKQRDPFLYISTLFPNYCSEKYLEGQCFQKAFLLSIMDDDETRWLYHSTKGTGPGTSGSPILNVYGELVGVNSTGWRLPGMEHVGGFSPVHLSVFQDPY